MDASFKPPNLFVKDNEPYLPSTQDNGEYSTSGKDGSFTPPNYVHHPDSFGMKASTVDAVSGVALESQSYIRSYSPYMDDGFSTDTSMSSPIIAEETMPTALTDRATQQAKTGGLGTTVWRVEDDTKSDETVYESAVGSEPHMDYEASTFVRNPAYISCIGQGKTAEHIDDIGDHDLARSIKGLYRILDLIAEQGSGGLGSVCILVRGSALTVDL